VRSTRFKKSYLLEVLNGKRGTRIGSFTGTLHELVAGQTAAFRLRGFDDSKVGELQVVSYHVTMLARKSQNTLSKAKSVQLLVGESDRGIERERDSVRV
jgi:hypothetical protein